MLDWLQLLNPVRHHHLLPPGASSAAPLPSAQWLARVLATMRSSSSQAASGAMTLMAPSDEALRQAGVLPGEMAGADLQQWLMRHLTLDEVRTGGLVQMFDGQLLRPDEHAPQWRDSEGRVVRPVGRAGECAGLMVQMVDRGLMPASTSLWQRIEAEPRLRRFAAALQHTGMATLLSCNGPFTVLAPSSLGLDRAAARLGLSPAALWADRDRLAELLAHHLLPGRWPSSALPWRGVMRTVAGQTLSLGALGLLRSGDLLLPLAPGSDRSCSNGVLHHLGEALLPHH